MDKSSTLTKTKYCQEIPTLSNKHADIQTITGGREYVTAQKGFTDAIANYIIEDHPPVHIKKCQIKVGIFKLTFKLYEIIPFPNINWQ